MDYVLLDYLIVGLVAIALAAYFFFASFLCGAGYQPTPREVAERMLELGEVMPGAEVVDLGAGTGGLLFLAAKRGARVTGVEAEPLRYLVLLLRRSWSPVRSQVSLKWGNLFEQDLTSTTVVFAFLWPSAMARLRSKLEKELPSGARVVSYWHPIPGWTPRTVDKRLRTYVYQMR